MFWSMSTIFRFILDEKDAGENEIIRCRMIFGSKHNPNESMVLANAVDRRFRKQDKRIVTGDGDGGGDVRSPTLDYFLSWSVSTVPERLDALLRQISYDDQVLGH